MGYVQSWWATLNHSQSGYKVMQKKTEKDF